MAAQVHLETLPTSGFSFSPEQEAVLAECESAYEEPGRFIFITGQAGTGKSTILKKLRRMSGVIVTSSTGLAAINVRGVTVHSFFGFKTGTLARESISSSRNWKAIRHARLIVIEEVSMIRADLMDAIDICLQKSCSNKRPFGGKTIIAFGDMLQLEPVVTEGEKDWIAKTYRSHFWFDAKVFGPPDQAGLGEELSAEPVEIETFSLNQVFRQIGDPDFIAALNAIRVGNPEGLGLINSRCEIDLPTGEMPTTLTFGNKEAQRINTRRMETLSSEERVFNAEVEGTFDTSDLPAPLVLTLKIGSQVMVVRNLKEEDGSYIANGDVGEVVGFTSDAAIVVLRDGRVWVASRSTWEQVSPQYDEEKKENVDTVEGRFSQIPLKLSWAITTHKSQGQTLKSAVLALERRAFAHGQLYTAVSRVRTLDGLYLRRKLQSRDLLVHERIREFCHIEAKKKNTGAFTS